MNTLGFSYFLLNIICCIFILLLWFQATNGESKYRNRVIIALALWQLFIFVVSKSGITLTVEFPPRFAIFFIIPSFLFTGIFLYQSKDKDWIKNVSLKSLTIFQSFRILVESLFVWSVAEGVLHENVTIEGYNYDMIFGFTAILIYVFVFHLKIWNEKALIIWNYLGLFVLATVIFVFISTLYFPQIYGFSKTPLQVSFLEYPYILVAAFMMPLAVFIHCLSILRLKKGKI